MQLFVLKKDNDKNYIEKYYNISTTLWSIKGIPNIE